jgi:hypothetical protein
LAVLSTGPLIEHNHKSDKDDGIDSTLIQATNWNAPHKLVLPASSVIARDPTGIGPAQSFPLDSVPSDNLHMPTTDFVTKAIQDAINATLANAGFAVTGDICASVNWNKSGWLQMIGQTIGNTGSGAINAGPAYHDLFVLFWTNIYNVDWPINGGRGASAEADWLANKTIPLPDARGRTLAMVDEGANVATLMNIIGATAGEQFHTLSIYETPRHTHSTPAHLALGGDLTGGGGAWSSASLDFTNDQATTGPAGGDGITGLTDGHLTMQPSLAIVYHIKL